MPQVISPALQWDTWQALDATTRYHGIALCHYGMAQRWLVVSSQAAMERAEASISKAQQRAWAASEQHLLHLQAQRFETPAAAHVALAALATTWRDHQGETADVTAHKPDAGKGRPPPRSPRKVVVWQRRAPARPAHAQSASRKQQSACFVLSTHIDSSQLSDPEVSRAYTAQAKWRVGSGCSKPPLFCVSSLFVKQPCRSQGLWLVMTFALLVYAVTQRRRRHQLTHHNETLPLNL